MQELGYPISDSYSGYRSYDYQTKLYNDYVDREGQAAADTYSARPGYSEHQTGLAFDILDSHGNLLDGPEYSDAIHWLHTHAHGTASSSDSNQARKPSQVTNPKHGTCATSVTRHCHLPTPALLWKNTLVLLVAGMNSRM